MDQKKRSKAHTYQSERHANNQGTKEQLQVSKRKKEFQQNKKAVAVCSNSSNNNSASSQQ
jgi:hypothetical protein